MLFTMQKCMQTCFYFGDIRPIGLSRKKSITLENARTSEFYKLSSSKQSDV